MDSVERFQITTTYEQRYHDQHLDLDFGRKTALLDSKPLVLTRKEYDRPALLIQHAGELVTRETLLLRVWGYNNQIRTRTLDVHILRLRRKLGEHSFKYIETIFSVGYRFQPFRGPQLIQRRGGPLLGPHSTSIRRDPGAALPSV